MKLWKKGLINRKKELHEGRWTYRLYSKREPISIESIADIPCFGCAEIDRYMTEGPISPVICNKLDRWLSSLIDKNIAGEYT